MAILDSLKRLRIPGLARFDQVLRLLFVLIEIGASGQLFGGHYDLPFVNAPGVRPNQAERRIVTFVELCKVGTALSADWMRPSRGENSSAQQWGKSIGDREQRSEISRFARNDD